MKVIYFSCTYSHFSHKYRCNAICKRFFSICIFNDWCQMLCLQFALQILRIIQIKLGYKNIWISCRRLCHSNLEINIDSLIQILHCDWSLCCIRRSGYFSVATKYLCFDTKVFLLIQIPSLHFGSCLTQSNGKVCLSRLQKVD